MLASLRLFCLFCRKSRWRSFSTLPVLRSMMARESCGASKSFFLSILACRESLNNGLMRAMPQRLSAVKRGECPRCMLISFPDLVLRKVSVPSPLLWLDYERCPSPESDSGMLRTDFHASKSSWPSVFLANTYGIPADAIIRANAHMRDCFFITCQIFCEICHYVQSTLWRSCPIRTFLVCI